MKSSLPIILLGVVLLLAPLTTAAATPAGGGEIDFAALDAAIKAQMRKHGLPGVALAVVEDGAIVYLHGTVLDVSTTPPRILRPGGVTAEMLEAIIGPVVVLRREAAGDDGKPSPGLLETHYAPRAELIFCQGPAAAQALATELGAALATGRRVGVLALDAEADAPARWSIPWART